LKILFDRCYKLDHQKGKNHKAIVPKEKKNVARFKAKRKEKEKSNERVVN
jgi:hypothetical protein